MQPDTSLIPHTLAQWFGLALATILAAVGGWFARRKREPHEIDKLRAETRHIHITTENAQVGLGLETFKELQSVVRKAEERREEWLRKEEQMRSQILFWRSKAEEIDGQLADAHEAIWKMESEVEGYEKQIERMNHTLKENGLNYDNTKRLDVRDGTKSDEPLDN